MRQTTGKRADGSGGRGSGSDPPKGLDPTKVPAMELFIGIIVSAIQAEPLPFFRQSGRVGLKLTDAQSVTLTFGDRTRPLSWGMAEDCGLRLTMSQAVLTRLLDRTLDTVHELATGGLCLEGDLELIAPFFRLIERGRSSLCVRLAR